MNAAGRFSFVRGLSLSDYMTLANGIGGAGAVLAVLGYMANGQPAWLAVALALYPLCLAMDFLDGRVARARGKSSALGADLDSLADVVSFGVAPAAMAFAAGMRGGWDALLLIYFVGCGISRLARYNVSASAAAAAEEKVTYFEGFPIPSSLALVALLAIVASLGHWQHALPLGALSVAGATLHPIALLFALHGSAMISKTLRIPKP